MQRIFALRLVGALALAALPSAALAEITVGFSISQTGPSSSLGQAQRNSLAFWPETIAGEKVRLVVVDDGSDPTTATTLARRLVTEDKVDIIVGSSSVAPAIAISEVAAENKVVQVSMSPIDLAPGKGAWTYRIAQPVTLMAKAVVDHMKEAGTVKTVGYIGFSDAYGDSWLRYFKPGAEAAGIRTVAEERYARNDTSVTGQVLKLIAARPDAILIGAAGTAAALPHVALRDRGYRGPIYQTHGAATADLIRIGGKAVEGAILPAGPVIVAEQLPDTAETKRPGMDYVTQYEGKHGAGSRTQFGAHAFDALQILQRIVPAALKTAKPGTPEFRQALKAALESEREIAAAHGVFNFTADDRFGLDERGRVLLTVKDGAWQLLR